jgi:hypothetical protein
MPRPMANAFPGGGPSGPTPTMGMMNPMLRNPVPAQQSLPQYDMNISGK